MHYLLWLSGVSLLAGAGLALQSGMDPAPIRVACVGDSITYGAGIENRETNSYPAVLASLLGPNYDVRNFGHSGTTMLKASGRPYWSVEEFQAANDFQPDLVVIMLGTNDAHPPDWRRMGSQFAADCRALIEHFSGLPSSPRIWLCLPPPLVPGLDDDRMTNLRDEIGRVLRAVASEKQVPLIDVEASLEGKPELFPDKVHPNAAGAAVIARTVASAIQR